jgi:HAD superfamily hydrolase (TIGR01509 family)
MLAPPAGVVFDMDGLLLDSERLAREAFDEACRVVGVEVEPEVYARCIGSNREATAAILVDVLGSQAVYGELDRHWDERYQSLINGGAVALKPGALELLTALTSYGIPRALATSTARPRATLKLQRAGVISYFSCLICGGETDRGKPHPDPYLAAVTALGTPPGASWALEDSENGVRAAEAAGLRVFQVPDLVAPSEALRGLGHRVAADLFEVLDELNRACAAR